MYETQRILLRPLRIVEEIYVDVMMLCSSSEHVLPVFGLPQCAYRNTEGVSSMQSILRSRRPPRPCLSSRCTLYSKTPVPHAIKESVFTWFSVQSRFQSTFSNAARNVELNVFISKDHMLRHHRTSIISLFRPHCHLHKVFRQG